VSGGLDLYWGVSGFVVKWVEAPIRREGLVIFIFIFFEVRGSRYAGKQSFDIWAIGRGRGSANPHDHRVACP